MQKMRYRFEPPAISTAETQRCLSDCTATRDSCAIPAQSRFAACDQRAAALDTICENNARAAFEICQRGAARTGKLCTRRQCDRPVCARTEIETCEADYRRCFAACGGSVVAE